MDSPIIKTLASFANICFEKNEKAIFHKPNLVNLIFKEKEPLKVKFSGNPIAFWSQQIEEEMFNLMYSGFLKFDISNVNVPYEIGKTILDYVKIPEEERGYLQKLAKRMYKAEFGV
ncbi:MAG: hypothetical protein AABX99_02125 [Nanoarchaeota archaeon]